MEVHFFPITFISDSEWYSLLSGYLEAYDLKGDLMLKMAVLATKIRTGLSCEW